MKRPPPRPAMAQYALGLVLLAAAVTFFVGTTMQSAALLREGRTATATVTGTTQPSWWNIFDCGRLLVRYDTLEGPTTATIWLDDETHMVPTGSTVSVVYDPSDVTRVRTPDDENSPVPWGPPFAVAGVVGVGMLLRGGLMRTRRSQWPAVASAVVPPSTLSSPAAALLPFSPLHGVAWDDETTRSRWRRHVQRAAAVAAAGAAIAAFATVTHLLVAVADDRRLAEGGRTTGTVTGGDYGWRGSAWVDVRYTVAGRTFDRELAGPSTDDLPEGSTVTVVYDRANPSRLRTPQHANHPEFVELLLVALPMVAVLALVVAGIGLGRARSWRRLLTSAPWQVWRAERGEVSYGNATAPALRLTAQGADGRPCRVDVRLSQVWVVSPDDFEVPRDGKVLVRPGHGRHGIVTAADATRLYGVLLPRSRRQATKWARDIDGYED